MNNDPWFEIWVPHENERPYYVNHPKTVAVVAGLVSEIVCYSIVAFKDFCGPFHSEHGPSASDRNPGCVHGIVIGVPLVFTAVAYVAIRILGDQYASYFDISSDRLIITRS